MSNALAKLDRTLKEHRFVLVRQDRHRIYRNPDNKIFVTPSTPSDTRWASNSLSSLKRVIASPAQPMVLAISDFEREQAAQRIAGQQKATAGMSGAGKSKRSRGTGFIYEDRNIPLMPEQEAAKQAEKLSREARQADRRERKLQRKAELQATRARRQQDKEFLEKSLDAFTEDFMKDWEPIIDGRGDFHLRQMRTSLSTKWFTNKLSCRLSCSKATKDARAWLAGCVKDARDDGATLPEIDEYIAYEFSYWRDCVQSHIPAAVAKTKHTIVSFVRKSVKGYEVEHEGEQRRGLILDSELFLDRLFRRAEEIGEEGDVSFYLNQMLHYFIAVFGDALEMQQQEAKAA